MYLITLFVLQIDEKSRRLAEMSLAEKMLQEQIEIERKQAEEMAEARQQRMKQFNKDYRFGGRLAGSFKRSWVPFRLQLFFPFHSKQP